MSTAEVLVSFLQVALLLGIAPLVVGLMRRVRARLEGRAGPRISQPWRDLLKLLSKERIQPEHTSWVFVLAPRVLLASGLLVAGLVPFINTVGVFRDSGDLFAVVYLLLLGTVFLALAGLDPGTAFGGMGSSREITVAALAEPAALLGIFALSVRAGTSSLSGIVDATLADPRGLASPSTLLALAAIAVVVLAETGRLPIDNPSTHLELTMIHEAMVLEYAGPDLAIAELASHLRLVIFLGLVVTLFVPWGIGTSIDPLSVGIGVVSFVAKIAALAVVVVLFELGIAKMRLFRVPELLTGAFILGFLAVTVSFFLA
ncbi:MAG: respiratory chain complex I subunit 1 family protein [Acidimicrobiia bacterium]